MKEDYQGITIYTDGCALTNPGKGGWAYIIEPDTTLELIGSGGEPHTTNNRMEMMAVLMALDNFPDPQSIRIVSDSMYVVDIINKYMYTWYDENDNLRASKSGMANMDLIKRMKEYSIYHDLEAKWVKGHSGNRNNERCDVLAFEAAKGVRRQEKTSAQGVKEVYMHEGKYKGCKVNEINDRGYLRWLMNCQDYEDDIRIAAGLRVKDLGAIYQSSGRWTKI